MEDNREELKEAYDEGYSDAFHGKDNSINYEGDRLVAYINGSNQQLHDFTEGY